MTFVPSKGNFGLHSLQHAPRTERPPHGPPSLFRYSLGSGGDDRAKSGSALKPKKYHDED